LDPLGVFHALVGLQKKEKKSEIVTYPGALRVAASLCADLEMDVRSDPGPAAAVVPVVLATATLATPTLRALSTVTSGATLEAVVWPAHLAHTKSSPAQGVSVG
jgi:hypothetical protein